ncbi:unnamed protein product [Allacma fusca]|uniref:t-SNARE coiled-coil homology domain-containing protein n=1 Tax=Allacma fusca TaxID=39272 RepID=A0A8J2Q3A4_9HEXA|nr:unnamed protein product [Allacma fusca]
MFRAQNRQALDSDDTVIPMEPLNYRLDQFLEQVDQLRKLSRDWEEDIMQVKKLQDQILSSPIPDDQAKQEMDRLTSTIKSSAVAIRSKLKEIELVVLKGEDESKETGIVSAELRIQKTQYSTLQRSFVDTMNSYSAAQTEYLDNCKARIKRQLEIVGSPYSDEDVERMIEDDSLAQNIFTQGIIHRTEEAKSMLADIEARHKDIIKLEKSITELHEMFSELADLVANQGEMIDRIETHVNEAQDAVEKGKEEIEIGHGEQISARMKKFYITIILLLVILFIGLIVYLT